jgi:hypothetical protein
VERVLALVLATVSVGCLVVAIAGMATDRFFGRSGLVLRIVAVLCFAGAVALGSASC